MEDIQILTVSINVAGEDYELNVDEETAQLLLNDPIAAENYVKAAYKANFQCEEDSIESLVEVSEGTIEYSLDNPVAAKRVWFSKGKPTQLDEEATIFFLQLREKYASKFDDRKSVKNKLWQLIANDMKTAGFIIGNSKENPAQKCKQKFINLEGRYVKHMEHMKTTGSDHKDPPPYFDLLHSILRHKHKVNPQYLVDSEPGPSISSRTIDEDRDNTEGEPCVIEIPENLASVNPVYPQNRFETSTESLNSANPVSPQNRFKTSTENRKHSQSEKILHELKRQFDIERNDRQKFLNEYVESQKMQCKQRQQLLDLFSQFFSKKRKRDESEDMEEESN